MEQPKDTRFTGNGAIALAIVVAAVIFGYAGGDDGPRYQLAASSTAVYRMNSDSGEMIACTTSGCARVGGSDRSGISVTVN